MKKTDHNYIAKLEKVIKSKYGDDAIQNPSKNWNEEKEREYLRQLKDFVQKQDKYELDHEPQNVNGILITKKLLNKESISNCPNCKTRIKTINDDIYITKFQCCEVCYIKYVDGREARWLEGWRPKNVTKSN